MLSRNRIADTEDAWGVRVYADTLVESVDRRFVQGGIYRDIDLPKEAKRKAERKGVVDDARGEAKERIAICLIAKEVRAAREYLQEKICAAHLKCDAWRDRDSLEENEMLAFGLCSQKIQCMTFVHDILKDLERGKYERTF